MNCPACGKALPDNILYCVYCGATMPTAAPPQAAPVPPRAAPVPRRVAPAPSPAPTPPPPRRRGYRWALVPAILLAAGGGLAWWMVARAPFARTYASMRIGEAGSLEACQTRDGGYIFIGHTDPSGAEPEDALVIKTNSRGKPVWSRTFGGGSSDNPLSVHETGDGGYIIAGCTKSFG